MLKVWIPQVFDDEPDAVKAKVTILYALLVAANAIAWLFAFVQFRDQPALLGTASLAYTFGLRHAVDPDHIAAIDNVTRKLMQEGKRAISAGFFFALGHSTVVIMASLLVALSIGALEAKFDWFKEVGGVIGTGVSATFLLIIAVINLVILISVYRAFAAVRRGECSRRCSQRSALPAGDLWSAYSVQLFSIVSRSWHLYPLGISLRPRLRYGQRGRAALDFGAGAGFGLRITDLVDPDLSGAVHRRDVVDRHHRWCPDGAGLRLGFHQAGQEALLQPHHDDDIDPS